MRRVCNWCSPAHVLGEKCSKCGSENLQSVGKVFVCRNQLCPQYTRTGLRHIFVAGEGGETHTVCPAALARENARSVARA